MSIFRGIERISLPDEGPSPEFVLMKSFESLECDPVREVRMTAALRECYRKYLAVLERDRARDPDLVKYYLMEHLYAAMQGLDSEKRCPRDEEREHALENRVRQNKIYGALEFNDSSVYWNQLFFVPENERQPDFEHMIKLYLCVADYKEVAPIFYELLERLLDLGEFFSAKMTCYERVDSICVWCGMNGYKETAALASVVAPKLKDENLPFVPFLDHVGINREFFKSYNAAIANLLCLYFLGDVREESEISCEGLLHRAVSGYFTDFAPVMGTREPNELDPERFGFKNAAAVASESEILQRLLKAHRELERYEYLTIIDSFNVMLGGWNAAETSLLKLRCEIPWLTTQTKDYEHYWL